MRTPARALRNQTTDCVLFSPVARVPINDLPLPIGTCDELFEIVTLQQTGKMNKLPIVLFGKAYWEEVVNWNHMGCLSKEEAVRQ